MQKILAFTFLVFLVTSCSSTAPQPQVIRGPDLVLGKDDRLPKIRHLSQPDYPAELRKANVEGVVTIEFFVDRYGNVVAAKAVDSPDPRLSVLAERAAVSWTFEPGIKNGVPVSSRLQVPITFDLK
jgi:TonB family protein